MRNVLRAVLVATAIGGVAVLAPATANATPSSGVTSVTLANYVIGSTDYVLNEITIAPGGSTGWHYHPGPVYGIVKQGVLTHDMSTCTVDGVYHAGQTIHEQPGSGYVHIGRNLGSTPLVLDVLYLDPVGDPLAVSVPNPGCSFQ